MFLSTLAKIFPAAWLLSIVFAGCGVWRSNENSAITFASPPKSEYPFPTSEPRIFQADIVIRAGETERRMFIARSGENRRIDYDAGTENHKAVLITDKEYLLYFKRKAYTERTIASDPASLYEPLTGHLLNTRGFADFEEMDRNGSVVEFRARLNEGTASEVVIAYDETVGLPVKQEFYSIEGGQRALRYSVELQNFRADVDAAFFQIPSDLRRTAATNK